jgi:hypothetical protein
MLPVILITRFFRRFFTVGVAYLLLSAAGYKFVAPPAVRRRAPGYLREARAMTIWEETVLPPSLHAPCILEETMRRNGRKAQPVLYQSHYIMKSSASP